MASAISRSTSSRVAAAWPRPAELRRGDRPGRIAGGRLRVRDRRGLAGVRTLIMSLGPVEDQSARRWMKALYESRLRAGLGTAEAVRAASLEVLRGRRSAGLGAHPFYWAGFVAPGDWR